MKYEWDEKKYSSNFKKHGIRFDDAIDIFKDPHQLEYQDEVFPERIICIGFSFHRGVLVVVIEESEKAIRIISARKATNREEKDYAQRIRNKKI